MTSVKSDSALVELGGARKERPGKAKLQSVSEGGGGGVDGGVSCEIDAEGAADQGSNNARFSFFFDPIPPPLPPPPPLTT